MRRQVSLWRRWKDSTCLLKIYTIVLVFVILFQTCWAFVMFVWIKDSYKMEAQTYFILDPPKEVPAPRRAVPRRAALPRRAPARNACGSSYVASARATPTRRGGQRSASSCWTRASR